jgi:hypothetical protein
MASLAHRLMSPMALFKLSGCRLRDRFICSDSATLHNRRQVQHTQPSADTSVGCGYMRGWQCHAGRTHPSAAAWC